MSTEYSVIIPLKNEESNIDELINELEPIMNNLKAEWELICIDDGSTDNTRQILLDLASKKPYLKLIFFAENYGQSSAFEAGFKAATGNYVITLDGDRQNNPLDIPKMLPLMKDADLVCGIRSKRKDPWNKKIISKLANSVRRRFCKDGVSDTGCSLKIYKREALSKIKMYNGMHRFLPALFVMEGFVVTEIPVDHRERTKGKSKYNFFNRSFNTLADLLAVRWMSKRSLKYKIEYQNKY